MNNVDRFFCLLGEHRAKDAIIWREKTFSFENLISNLQSTYSFLQDSGIRAGSIVAIEGDFSPTGIVALLALMQLRAIAVPMTSSVITKHGEFCLTAEVEWRLQISGSDEISIEKTTLSAKHLLYRKLLQLNHPGLVLFSSGSTGKSKGVVHDWELLLEKYLKPRHCYRTVAFLLFDHIGGVDTLFYNLANGSALIALPDHRPETVCEAIEKHRAEVLPVSPTFLNLLLLSGVIEKYDLSSLEIITYGAEVMPQSTLDRANRAFPKVRFVQKFGTTEIGTLRSASRDSNSPWVKIGGEGYQIRVVNGLLEIKATSAMLGYINAPSPFTEDGWFITGDAVEVDGEFLRFLGRNTEVINVGGEKVYPAEVENILMQMEGVKDALVFGESNPIIGNIVVARVNLSTTESSHDFRKRMREFCKDRLAPYQVPARVEFGDSLHYSARHKKLRTPSS